MLVFTICKCLPAFVRSRAKHFCTLVLGSLGESDPSVVGVVWEAGLTIIATVEVRESCYMHQYVNTCACGSQNNTVRYGEVCRTRVNFGILDDILVISPLSKIKYCPLCLCEGFC